MTTMYERLFVASLMIDHDECVPFEESSKTSSGHPRVTGPGGVIRSAGQWVCHWHKGAPQGDANHSRHLCRERMPSCINPRHLEWGTAQQNVDDRKMHGPHSPVQRRARLTPDLVRWVRWAVEEEGLSQTSVAGFLGYDRRTNVGNIITRHTWAHVE